MEQDVGLIYRPAANEHHTSSNLENNTTGSGHTQAVYGNRICLIVGIRLPGFHSAPHTNPCDQLVYINSGAVDMFVGENVFHALAGDFLRIPADVVRWNQNVGHVPSLYVAAFVPGLQDDPALVNIAIPLLSSQETIAPSPARNTWMDPSIETVPGLERRNSLPTAADNPEKWLHCRSNQSQRSDALSTDCHMRMVYGERCSLASVELSPGYQSSLRKHDSEQIAYVLDGDVRVRLGDRDHDVRAGDFVRFPGGTPHAIRVVGRTPSRLIVAHCPGIQADPRMRGLAIPLVPFL